MGWISISDEMPKKNTFVAWLKMNDPIKNGVSKKWISMVDGIGFSQNHNGYHKCLMDIDATHWMPLPEPPK